jgi:hypothetical protein
MDDQKARSGQPRVAFASHASYLDMYNETSVAARSHTVGLTASCATMEGRETVDPEIKIGHLNNRGYSVRPSPPQLTARWLILAAWVVGLDAAAINWTMAATKRVWIDECGSGGFSNRSYSGYDGSEGRVMRNQMTGKTTVRWAHSPTATGLCDVWWPSVVGGIITLIVLALAATRNGRRLIAEFPLPRMTTRRLMIAVAVIGIEATLIINVTRKLGGDPRSSGWPPIVFCLAVPPTLVFLPAFGRDRPSGAEKG